MVQTNIKITQANNENAGETQLNSYLVRLYQTTRNRKLSCGIA